MNRRKRPARSRGGIHAALFARASNAITDTSFRAAIYSAIGPSSTFVDVEGVPQVYFRRFTPCGRFFITMSHNNHDLVVYRLETGGRRQLSPTTANMAGVDFEREAFLPRAPPPAPIEEPDFKLENGGGADDRGTGEIFSKVMSPAIANGGPSRVGDGSVRARRGTGLLETLPVPLRADRRLPVAKQNVSKIYSCHFSRFFTRMYEAPIATGEEELDMTFCLMTMRGKYVILASYQTREHPEEAEDVRQEEEAALNRPVPAVRAGETRKRFTLHLVEVETGVVADRFVLLDDFVPTAFHAGVHMYRDMLLVLSVRHQILHVIKIQENMGRFTQEGRIGAMCLPDDEREIARARTAEAAYQRRRQEAKKQLGQPSPGPPSVSRPAKRLRVNPNVAGSHEGSDHGGSASSEVDTTATAHTPQSESGYNIPPETDLPSETGLGGGKLKQGFYTGLMQRLLVHIYRRHERNKNQRLFYRMVELYSMLIMLKAQFLDEDHLLIRLGSQDRTGTSTVRSLSTCFLVVYCISSTKILSLYENSSATLLSIYEKYRDQFVADANVSAVLPVRPSTAVFPNGQRRRSSSLLRELVERNANESAEDSRFHTSQEAAGGPRAPIKRVRKELSVLPMSCQTRDVSPYLDQSLFSYNDDFISALDGTRAVSPRELTTVKFISKRSGAMRFKLSPGDMLDASGNLRRGERGYGVAGLTPLPLSHRKTMVRFLFHPSLPFAISMADRPLSTLTVNFHVYGHHS